MFIILHEHNGEEVVHDWILWDSWRLNCLADALESEGKNMDSGEVTFEQPHEFRNEVDGEVLKFEAGDVIIGA